MQTAYGSIFICTNTHTEREIYLFWHADLTVDETEMQ